MCGFYRSGLKTGLENDIFWSKIGSGFGEPGGPHQEFPGGPPLRGSGAGCKSCHHNHIIA